MSAYGVQGDSFDTSTVDPIVLLAANLVLLKVPKCFIMYAGIFQVYMI